MDRRFYLTRAQELGLLRIALDNLLDGEAAANGHGAPRRGRRKTKRPKWTPERRAKFVAAMQKTWAKKRARKAKPASAD